MQVLLSIKDDSELRKHIRECIQGEITSIARAEIVTIAREVFDKKTKSVTGDRDFIRNVVRDAVKEYVLRELKSGTLMDGIPVQAFVQAEVSARLDETFKKMGLAPEQLEK